jgi:hypothetical protein
VLVIAILPLALIAASLASETGLVYAQLESGDLNPGLYFRAVCSVVAVSFQYGDRLHVNQLLGQLHYFFTAQKSGVVSDRSGNTTS